MHRYQLSIGKADFLRKRFIEGNYNAYALAGELKVSTKTTWRYQREFEKIRAEYPDRLKDFGFYPGEPRTLHWATAKYDELALILPVLLSESDSVKIERNKIWELYKNIACHQYAYPTFKSIFTQWVKDHVTPDPPIILASIAKDDLTVLKHWRESNDHRKWQIAKALQLAQQGLSRKEIIDKVETSYKTLTQWLGGYKEHGLKAFDFKPNPRNQKSAKAIEDRKTRLLELLHESPKLHGLNRTSWSMTALTAVYNKLYTPQLNYWQICRYVDQMGYSYKKTREMLTSPDPKFREKINKIQSVLQKLKPDEKFFSIDEYGPVSIKIKGGRILKHETESPDVVPEKQRAKGFLICTAALELSTNQVTHFYSLKKNTFEMIKLIDMLIAQYHDQEMLYLCWDAVSWHNSKILKNYIEDHNKVNKPGIRLVPLPASTQFLNVIESVFAGLARAVIHNSDYADVDECKRAITLHFSTRNEYFIANPKHAGRKIWGKEIVKAKFSEHQHCRNRSAMSGAKGAPAKTECVKKE